MNDSIVRQTEPALPLWIAPLLIAPFIGSFLGVFIRRWPTDRPIVVARSVCEACGRMLAIRDLIPLFSFAALHGHCRRCGAHIPVAHVVIEVAALAVAACSIVTQQDAARVWLGCILGWGLLPLAWIDWKHKRLPDVLTLPLVLLGLLAVEIVGPDRLTDHATAAALGYLAFRAISLGYRLLRGREGLGQGDAKLLAAAGAWAGLQLLPEIVLTGALFGLCLAGFQAIRGSRLRPDMPIAFGPGLALATWVVWLMSS